MKKWIWVLLAVIILGVGLFMLISGGGSGGVYVTIGTGGVTGVYYPAGGALAKLVNRNRRAYGIRHVSVRSTAGSVYNVNAVMSGELDVGIVQSDRQYQAVKGLAEWKDRGPQADLRAICSLHPELVTLVAADNANINTLMDIKEKRVNIGNPGSGQRGNALDVLRAAGIDWRNDIKAEALKATESANMLQDDRIDAFFYTVGHPNGAIKEATSGRRRVHLVPITGMDALLKEFPYYAASVIPIKLYPRATNKEDVLTVGVVTTVVSSAKVPDNVVYAIIKELFENLKEFRTLHPAFAGLEKESMLKGLSAPLHPGAVKYFREAGLK